MATLVLPAHSDSAFYDFEVDLEGRTYTVELRWNARSAAWYLTLRDAAGAILVAGRKVVLGAGLLGRSPAPGLPPGGIVAIDTSGADLDPGRNDLGTRVALVYYEAGA